MWRHRSPVTNTDEDQISRHKARQHSDSVAEEWTICHGNQELCASSPSVSGWGACGVELSLIEDYLLNYSSTASVKQPWITETSQRQTLGPAQRSIRRRAQFRPAPPHPSLHRNTSCILRDGPHRKPTCEFPPSLPTLQKLQPELCWKWPHMSVWRTNETSWSYRAMQTENHPAALVQHVNTHVGGGVKLQLKSCSQHWPKPTLRGCRDSSTAVTQRRLFNVTTCLLFVYMLYVVCLFVIVMLITFDSEF